jgi:uncharacterized protein
MDEFGLSESTVNLIRRFFLQFPEVVEVKIYGSRAMGNYKKGSDIDLVLFGNIEYDLLRMIYSGLDALPTPYKYDVTDYNTISNPNLKDHIDRVGKTFYIKEETNV